MLPGFFFMTQPNLSVCRAFVQAILRIEGQFGHAEAFQFSESINGFSEAHIQSLNEMSQRCSIQDIAACIAYSWRNPCS
tara:strand:- start:117 stop:353 length:237 start_codon:yes stop_codon:yes gene_type:complete